MVKVILKRSDILRKRHLWVFNDSIYKIIGKFRDGDLVYCFSKSGEFLGKGYINTKSAITIRILTFSDEEINQFFFEKRIKKALSLREPWLNKDTNAFRLINAEGDMLPGLIVDKYNDFLVIQIHTLGMEVLRDFIIKALVKVLNPKGIYERNDIKIRLKEGLTLKKGIVYGEEPEDLVIIKENGLNFAIDIKNGQKTGFFLDQKINRDLIKKLSYGRRVLDLFSYTGAFSVYALSSGAEYVNLVENSKKAVEIAEFNMKLNNFPKEKYKIIKENVKRYFKNLEETFDLIIVDPPDVVKNIKNLEKGLKFYEFLIRESLKRLSRDGYILICCCSYFISDKELESIILNAAYKEKVDLQIISKTFHPFDHPIKIPNRESEYLKSFLCRKL